MKVPQETVCKVCQQIFCCTVCRRKHEMKAHAILARTTQGDCSVEGEPIYLFCPLCEKKPLLFREDQIPSELLNHIESNHLPLHCQKCEKIYTKIDDLNTFSKCISPAQECSNTNQSCGTESSKATVTRDAGRTTISTQTSPMFKTSALHSSELTPTSLLNLYWKSKKMTHEEFVSDSVSSIRNISSINNSSLRRSIGFVPHAKGKLVRTTSTPVHAEVYIKPKEQTFEASSGPVSSIYNNASDSDASGGVLAVSTPTKQLDTVNRLRKVGGRAKISAVTPLRQVMSKSIQKAFAEHGLPTGANANAVMSSPLDLRLSPAIRRTQSELCYTAQSEVGIFMQNNAAQLHAEILLSSKKLTTESIVITRTQRLSSFESTKNNYVSAVSSNDIDSSSQFSCSTGSVSNSVYKTCHCVEIITSTELNSINIKENQVEESVDELRPMAVRAITHECSSNLSSITPIGRSQGSVINKKLINFETPSVAETEPSKDKISSPGDVFFTPNSTPMRKSSLRSNSPAEIPTDNCVRGTPCNLSNRLSGITKETSPHKQDLRFKKLKDGAENLLEGDVFRNNTEPNELKDSSRKVGRTWSLSSLVSSVMRLPLTVDARKSNAGEDNINKRSLIRRCASIAGSLIRSKPLVDEDHLQTLKRKRTYTMDNQFPHSPKVTPCSRVTSPNSDGESASAASKRIRIQGRQPIGRMRKNS